MISPFSTVGFPKAEEVSTDDYRKLKQYIRPEIAEIAKNNNSICVKFTFSDHEKGAGGSR